MQFYTIEEAAVAVRRGSQFVRKGIKSGALNASLQGSRYLITEQDLKAWVKGPSKKAAVTTTATNAPTA